MAVDSFIDPPSLKRLYGVTIRRVTSDRLVDSAFWFLLYRPLIYSNCVIPGGVGVFLFCLIGISFFCLLSPCLSPFLIRSTYSQHQSHAGRTVIWSPSTRPYISPPPHALAIYRSFLKMARKANRRRSHGNPLLERVPLYLFESSDVTANCQICSISLFVGTGKNPSRRSWDVKWCSKARAKNDPSCSEAVLDACDGGSDPKWHSCHIWNGMSISLPILNSRILHRFSNTANMWKE